MEVARNTKTVVEEVSNSNGYRDWISKHKYENRANRNYRNVIIRGSISFVYIRILKGECKMSNVTIISAEDTAKMIKEKFDL